MVIQQLLEDGGADRVDHDLVMVEPHGLEVPADWRTLQSAETYVGHRQSAGFAQERVAGLDVPAVYTLPDPLGLNEWGLSGEWTVAGHAAILNERGGRIAFRFHARDLNLVMGPSTRGASIPFSVFLDGQPANDAHGSDVNPDGTGMVSDQRTYQLVRQPGPITDRLFEVEFQDAGVDVYCFTFG
jgi:hypothetical protein